jgi:cellulose biosynthesis protein BcsQ
LDIKGLAVENTIMCFTSFQFMDGAYFNAYYLAQAFASQGRKVLLLDVDNQYRYFKNRENTESIIVDNVEIKTLSNPSYNTYTSSKMKDFLEGLKKEYDLIIMLNENLATEAKAKLLMTLVDINLIVLDSRITPKKRVADFELMKEEYKFPSMYYVLNRYDYTPSLFKEFSLYTKQRNRVIIYFFKLIRKLKISNEKTAK